LIRDEKHLWDKCECELCGKTNSDEDAHTWDGCVCYCGATRHIKKEGVCTCKNCGIHLPCDYELIDSYTIKRSGSTEDAKGWREPSIVVINVEKYLCTHCGKEIEEESIGD